MAAWNGVLRGLATSEGLDRLPFYLDGRVGEGWTADGLAPRGELRRKFEIE